MHTHISGELSNLESITDRKTNFTLNWARIFLQNFGGSVRVTLSKRKGLKWHLHCFSLFPSFADLWPAWEHGVPFDRWSLVSRFEWYHILVANQDSMAIDAVEIALSIKHPIMTQVDCSSNRECKLVQIIKRSCDVLCVCTCVWKKAHEDACVIVLVNTLEYVLVCIFAHRHIHANTHTCTHTHMHTHTNTHTCMHTHICTPMHTHTQMYINTHQGLLTTLIQLDSYTQNRSHNIVIDEPNKFHNTWKKKKHDKGKTYKKVTAQGENLQEGDCRAVNTEMYQEGGGKRRENHIVKVRTTFILMVSWYFEPSQWQRITSGLKETSIHRSPNYSSNKYQTTHSPQKTQNQSWQIYIKQSILRLIIHCVFKTHTLVGQFQKFKVHWK